ncbi:transglutaminase-like domain-containing protein [Gordonia soli]|uniref:Transglutaminase-like domain-containing protein n=1 Tax=Gordonia soli NBRC 108243 TaxID=1223545 RepID=M0QNM5_9ACTN|nr:transglutaminase family protein [Gordonia soli]GAC70183.1 hypothetical protein GS4_32_01280 [Gordonia soli NBRC 108243]
MTTSIRDISATLEVEVTAATVLDMQVAVARVPGLGFEEELRVAVDGLWVTPSEVVGECESRIHRLTLDPGMLTISYSATVSAPADPIPVAATDPTVYLRPSRYAECDKFYGFASRQFDTSRTQAELLTDVTDYVKSRLSYIPGSSDPIDGAADTLLAGAGVCRDYAHLVVALLRALNVPARVVAVYAPGCSPMDFHAVAEALVDGEWVVVDATGLAPRQSLVRIATGRDAADTAFLDNHGGSITLKSYQVFATVRGDLPDDDGTARIRIS